jgi:ABC-type multidrug transport system fused ATPase/permease subunit
MLIHALLSVLFGGGSLSLSVDDSLSSLQFIFQANWCLIRDLTYLFYHIHQSSRSSITKHEVFAGGQAAAFKIFETLNRIPESEDIRGDIEFRDVYFSYPTRPDEKIFKDFSLNIPRGMFVTMSCIFYNFFKLFCIQLFYLSYFFAGIFYFSYIVGFTQQHNNNNITNSCKII